MHFNGFIASPVCLDKIIEHADDVSMLLGWNYTTLLAMLWCIFVQISSSESSIMHLNEIASVEQVPKNGFAFSNYPKSLSCISIVPLVWSVQFNSVGWVTCEEYRIIERMNNNRVANSHVDSVTPFRSMILSCQRSPYLVNIQLRRRSSATLSEFLLLLCQLSEMFEAVL